MAYTYDVALSFAGEDRSYVAAVAEELQDLGVRLFYDEYETVTLWGKDLYTHLQDVYEKQARYVVIFASASYVAKVWTSHERASAQARALTSKTEYILPARFDDTEIPGLLPTIGYISLKRISPSDFAKLIVAKIGFATPALDQPTVGQKTPLPGEVPPKTETLVERAARLRTMHLEREERDALLHLDRGVALANKEVMALFEKLSSTTKALMEQDEALSLRTAFRDGNLALVSGRNAAFTLHWGLQWANSLQGSRLYIREYNHSYWIDGSHRPFAAETEYYAHLAIDNSKQPVWRYSESDSLDYTTAQVADRHLSRLVERYYAASPSDKPRIEEGDSW